MRVEAWVLGSPPTPQTLSPRKPWYAAFLSLHSQLAHLQRKTRLVLFFLADSGCSESTLVPLCHSHLPWNGQVDSLCTKCLRLFIKCSWKPLHPMSPHSPPRLSLHHLSIRLLARDFRNVYFIVMLFWFRQTKIWPKGKAFEWALSGLSPAVKVLWVQLGADRFQEKLWWQLLLTLPNLSVESAKWSLWVQMG